MKNKLSVIMFLIFSNFLFSNEIIVEDNNKIGLVLSGGGAKGFAHIGLLKILDEEKIPVDYIVGTSMGSIIGALYSMGYSANEIEEIVLSRDWLSYFSDSISRENELIENKEDRDKYIMSLSLDNWKLSLPKGAIRGQTIDKILEELYLNTKDIDDFSKLPIPFACVATDAETGKEVVYTKGYLPEVIRASMSLPGLLDPVELDGKLLLDGGLSNNFPASVAIELGANYVIGGEVLGELQKKEDLKSAILIMNQAMAYKRVDVTDEEKKKVDILISPNTEKYNIFSFSKVKEIIDEGEKAARVEIAELKKLKNEFKFNQIKSKKIEISDNFLIDSIEISGNKNISTSTIDKMIEINLPVNLSISELSKLIDKLYNSRLFSKVTYKISGTTLKINVEEEFNKELKMGFNYNGTTKGDLFLKIIDKGSKFSGNKSSLEILLGKDEAVKLENTWYVGPINKFGVSLTTNYSNIEDYTLMVNKNKILNFNINLINVDFMLGTFLSNSQIIGLGIKKEFLDIQSNTLTSYDELSDYNSNYELIYLKYLYDSIDNKYYPKKGTYFESQLNYYSIDKLEHLNFSNFKLKFNKPLKLKEKYTLNIGFDGAYIDDMNMSPIYFPALGGVYNRQNSIPFWGLNPSEYLSDKIISGFGELLYEWKPYRYYVLRFNYASLNPNSTYNQKDIFGGGIGISVKTPIGPLQFILSQSNKQDLMGYLNIGYNF